MDLFGIKRRRAEREAEAQRLADEKAAALKVTLERRKKLIDGYLAHHSQEHMDECQKLYAEDLKEVEKKNTVCPVCGSRNRIHKFVRRKGSLDGKVGGNLYGSGNLFGSSCNGSISGDIHGELDTLKVNECKDCGNQWEIAEPAHRFISDYLMDCLDPYEGRVDYLYRRAKEVLYEGKWPTTSCGCEVYKTVPRMVLEYLTCKWFFSYEGPRENRKKPYQILECPCEERKDREYLFEFSDEVWDIYKRLTKREEYENTDYPESDE